MLTVAHTKGVVKMGRVSSANGRVRNDEHGRIVLGSSIFGQQQVTDFQSNVELTIP